MPTTKGRRQRLKHKQISECYKALERVLKYYNVPDFYYSIGKPVDDCVCIQYKDGIWIVFEGCRGQRIHSRSFNNFYEAGCSLIESVVIGNVIVDKMKKLLDYECIEIIRKDLAIFGVKPLQSLSERKKLMIDAKGLRQLIHELQQKKNEDSG